MLYPPLPLLPQAEESGEPSVSPDTEALHLAALLWTTSLPTAFLSRLSKENFAQFPRYFGITSSLEKTLRIVLDLIPNDSLYSV